MNPKINSTLPTVPDFLRNQGCYCLFVLSLLIFVLYSHLESIVLQTAPVLVSITSPFSGSVEKTAGQMIIKQARPYSLAQTPVNLKENSFYLVAVDHEGEGGFRFDFCGTPGYDHPEQERYVPSYQKKAVYSVFSGYPPIDTTIFFRIFFEGDYAVVLHNIHVVKAPSWYRYRTYVLFTGFGLLLLSIWMMLCKHSSREALLLFAMVLGVYLFIARVPADSQGSDNIFYLPVADSLLKNGTVLLDDFLEGIQKELKLEIKSNIIILTPSGSVNLFPLGPSLLAVPFLFFGQLLGQDLASVAEFTAKVFAAGTAAIIYFISLEFGLWRRYAVILALIFAFATSHFPIHAGGYWSHNCSSFLASLLFLTVLRIFKDPISEQAKQELHTHYPFLIALIMVLGYVCRPDFSLWVLTMLFFIVFRSVYGAALIGIYSLLLGGVFILWSLGVYGTFLPPYFAVSRIGLPNIDIMIRQLFSPNRGLFIYNPIFFLSIFAVYHVFFFMHNHWIFLLMTIYVAISILLLSGFGHWWAGCSFGPRIYASLFPVFTVLLIPYFLWIQNQPARWKSGLLILFVLAGILINAPSAFDRSANEWNAKPALVDEHPERVSDWADIQFMRFYKHLWHGQFYHSSP